MCIGIYTSMYDTKYTSAFIILPKLLKYVIYVIYVSHNPLLNNTGNWKLMGQNKS